MSKRDEILAGMRKGVWYTAPQLAEKNETSRAYVHQIMKSFSNGEVEIDDSQIPMLFAKQGTSERNAVESIPEPQLIEGNTAEKPNDETKSSENFAVGQFAILDNGNLWICTDEIEVTSGREDENAFVVQIDPTPNWIDGTVLAVRIGEEVVFSWRMYRSEIE